MPAFHPHGCGQEDGATGMAMALHQHLNPAGEESYHTDTVHGYYEPAMQIGVSSLDGMAWHGVDCL